MSTVEKNKTEYYIIFIILYIYSHMAGGDEYSPGEGL